MGITHVIPIWASPRVTEIRRVTGEIGKKWVTWDWLKTFPRKKRLGLRAHVMNIDKADAPCHTRVHVYNTWVAQAGRVLILLNVHCPW